MPAYTVVDLMATRAIGKWRLNAEVNNLFARRVLQLWNTQQRGRPTFNAYPAPERSFFFSAEYRFGR